MDAELIRGSGGVFEIFLDGNKAYSKKETGEFPEDDRILDMIELLRKR